MNCEFSLLPSEALLHVTGPDALTFLQGQTTCDTRLLDASTALPGAYCTPQGRTVCDFLLLQLGPEHVALRMRRDILEHAAATFGKYIIFSRAELDAERKNWQVACCFGETAGDLLARLCGSLPGGRYTAVSAPGLLVVQVDDRGHQFECYLDRSVHADLPQELAQVEQDGSAERWNALQIARGIGRLEAGTIETFIPQMLNYDLTGHISFNKGCYTGQEVVARLHYRGKAKRRMYLASFDDSAEAAPGTDLYTGGSEQSVGRLVNRASLGDGHAVALVVATAAGVEGGLHLAGPGGPSLSLRDLPYTIEAD